MLIKGLFRSSMCMNSSESSTGTSPQDGGEGEAIPPSPGDAGAGEQSPDEEGSGHSDDPKLGELDSKTQNYIKSLRKEAASYRTKLNQMETKFESFQSGLSKLVGGGAQNDLTPEQQLADLSGQYESAVLENSILKVAVANEIPQSGMEFFEFKISKKLSELEEGEELDEEAISELAAEVRQQFGQTGGASTSPGKKANQGTTPKPSGGEEVSYEEFLQMKIGKRSELYGKNPELYKQHYSKAKMENKLV